MERLNLPKFNLKLQYSKNDLKIERTILKFIRFEDCSKEAGVNGKQ